MNGTNSDYVYSVLPSADNFAQFYDSQNDEFTVTNPSQIPLRVGLTADVGSVYDDPIMLGTFTSDQGLYQAFVDAGVDGGSQGDIHDLTTSLGDFRTAFIQTINNVNDLYQKTKQESLRKGEFTLEPNQFVPFEDRVRVIWSREVGSN